MNLPIIALLGGAIGLDATSFAQVMISRPLVAGALTGWLLGDPVAGTALGALHEFFELAVLPIGASRYPEAGTATVAAVAALLSLPGTIGMGAVLLALVFALGWERVAGRSVLWFRRGMERILFREARAGGASPRDVEIRQMTALTLDFARAALIALLGAIVGSALLTTLVPRWNVPDVITQTLLTGAISAALGGALVVFGGWADQRRAFLIGALGGTALLLLR